MIEPHPRGVAEPSPAAPAPVRVVLVDDSSVIRQRLAALLTAPDGVSVVGQATNARDGAEVVHRLLPDVVITDLHMPEGGGLRLLEQIRDLTQVPTVAVLTNSPHPAYLKRCRELGVSHFFDKSREFHKVCDLVQQVHAQRVSASTEASLVILVVEDNPPDARHTVEVLHDWEVAGSIHVVATVNEALEFLHRTGRHAAAPRPDLVLLDLYLGDGSGFDVLRQMKMTVELVPISVVVLSGSREATDIARSYALQARSFVAKPLDPPRHLAPVLGGKAPAKGGAARQAPETDAP